MSKKKSLSKREFKQVKKSQSKKHIGKRKSSVKKKKNEKPLEMEFNPFNTYRRLWFFTEDGGY
jgi:hypothetical protein